MLWLRIHLPMQKMWVRFLDWEDPQEKEMATHSSILDWRIPWTEDPGRLKPMGLQRVGHNLMTDHVLMHKVFETFKYRRGSLSK